jgi:hypothetical protein
MTDIQRLLKGHSWLQCTFDKERAISAFWRRYHKAPKMCIESKIGDTVCFYVGPIAKGESNDNKHKAI